MKRILTIASMLAVSALADESRLPGIQHEEITVKAPFPMPVLRVPIYPKLDFVITDFGAKPGGKEKCTAAISKAIDACHKQGGGRVVIPEGEWLTGAVHLKSQVNLHLAKGATLFFSDDPKDYRPAVRSSWEGWECFNYSPLVYAYDCENVAITGEGKLEARMETWKEWSGRPPAHMEALKHLYNSASKGAPVEERQMAKGENNLRPQFIQFNRCRNVLMEDVRIRNSPFWTVHLLLCDGAVIRGVDISAIGHNNDGIDPECTRNLLVENCRFDQGDDAMAIKSGTNHDGWRLNTPSQNIVIRNCTMIRGHQLVAIGSELSGGVRNVHVHDCRFDARSEPYHLLYIKTNRRRGGFVENITLEKVEATAASIGVLGIETDVLYQWRKLVPCYEERLTPIRGIIVRNVRIGSTATPFRILGDKDMPVKDVLLEDISIGTVKGQRNRFENAENIREKDIRIEHFTEAPDKGNKNR